MYLIQVNICLIILFLAYRLVRNSGKLILNRSILLVGLVFCFTAPALNFSISSTVAEEVTVLPEFTVTTNQTPEVAVESSNPTWNASTAIMLLYFGGVLFFVFVFLVKAWKLGKLMSLLEFQDGVARSTVLPTFSFLQRIVLNVEEERTPSEEYQILAHEQAHVRQWHSIDLLIAEFAQMVLWFNPFIYLWKKEMKETHEFLADKAVVENAETIVNRYSALIVRQALGPESVPVLAHSFTQSQIKRRIEMLDNQKNRSARMLAYFLFIPVFSTLFFFTACSQEEDINKQQKDNGPQTFEEGLEPEYNPDEMAEFPGGMEALMTYMGTIHYPDEAKELGLEGRVVVEFAVEKDGRVLSAEVVNEDRAENMNPDQYGNTEITDPHPILAEAAVDHILNMPQWTPGKKDGKAVMTKLVLPIVFKMGPTENEE